MMSVANVFWIVGLYESISIQTRQITVKDLNKDKIELFGGLLKLTINSNEDVYINIKDIKAIYGKNRREKE